MEEDKDLLSELRSLGGQPEEQPEPEVGVSDTAQQLEGEGFFNDLSRKHQIDTEFAKDKAAMRSADSVVEPVTGGTAIQRVGNVPGLVTMPGVGRALDAVTGAVSDWHNTRQREFQERRERSKANWDRLAEQERLKQPQEQPVTESLEAKAQTVPGGLTDPQQYVEGVKGIVPGIVKAAGLTLQSPDVLAAKGQYGAAGLGARQLDIMDRIDAGQEVAEADDPMGYRHMSPAERVIARTDLEEAQARFDPTPIRERPLYQAGEAVQEFAKGLIPASPGYEDAAGRQVGEGLGSLIFGLPVAYLGTIPSTLVFGGMGVGESTQRAVDWDRKEKAAGREGLAEDQIITAGLLGIGPGTTDVLPVEVLFGRLPLRIPPVLRGAVAQGVARIGGQAFIEGVQEGGQAFLQNLIAREVYDPQQRLIDGVSHEAQIGASVGGIAQVAKDLGAWVLRSASGRRGHSHAAATPATEQQSQPSSGLDLGRYADEKAETDAPASPMETAPPLSGAEPLPAQGEGELDGERLATRNELGEYMNLETQVMLGQATPEVEDRLEEFEEKLLAKFRETGLPGDERLTERRPVDSVEDIRLAFASATEEEISRFWRVGTPPEKTEEVEATASPEVGTSGPESAKPTDDTRRRFREIIAGGAPRARWAEELGASPEDTAALVDEAVREGLLRRDGRGRVMRTAKSRGMQLASVRRRRVLRPEFVAAWPETEDELFAELDKWLPKDVAVQIEENLKASDLDAYGLFDSETGELLLDASLSIREAFQIGAHESTHALRWLYTEKEWATLLAHARESGFEAMVAIDEYRASYSEQLRANGAPAARIATAVQELIEQEIVATMAEYRILAKAEFPNKIAELLDRIAKFFEALRNALHRRGFQTADDVFERFKSGEVGARGTAEESWQRWHKVQLGAKKKPGLPNPIRMGQGKGAGLETPQKTLSELVGDVNEALGLTTRHGRLDPGLKASAGRQGKRVAGQFDTITGVTRIATPNDIATLAHEGGHALESRADIKADLDALKKAHVEELTTHPAIDVPPRQLAAGGGFSGVELDADTQQKLIQSVVTDRTWRQLGTVAGQSKSGNWAGRKHNPAAYISAQEAASKAWGMLVRRVGQKRATAYLDDVRQHVPAATSPAAYVRTRFSASGVPAPRAAVTATPTQLSEGFAEWFRLYLTKPKEAFRLAPAFVLEFEDILDGADPGLLEKLEGVQKGFQALLDASPAGAVRSRVQSTVQGGRISRFRKEVDEKGLRATISDRMYAIYTAAVDGKHPMKRAVRYLLETAETNLALGPQKQLILKAINDPYKRWRLAEHSRVWATNILQNGVRLRGDVNATGPSFHEALTQAFGGTRRGQWHEERAEIFGSYLVARRMLAEFARHARGETDNQPDALIDARVWARARRDIEKAYPEFVEAAKLLYRFNKNHLRLKHEAGFLSRDLFLELNSREDYVPLNRIMDDGGPSQLGKGSKGQNKRKLIYRFKGSTRDFINPLESIVQDVYATQGRIALNDTIAALDRLARAAGPGGGAIAERIPANDMKGVTVDLREVVKSAARDLSESDAEGLVELIDDLFDQEASATIFRATPTNEKGEPIIYLWEEGKRVPIRLGDDRIGRDLFEGFVGFGQEVSEWWIDSLALGTQAFRAGVTRAPAYILVNFLRDQLATAVLSPGYIPFVTGAKGLKHAIADDATAKAYKSFAGLSGVESGLAERVAKADVLRLRRKGFTAAPTTWSAILRATEVTETATRMGHFKVAYDRALADGMSEEAAAVEAAYSAHDVLDFSRKGAKTGTIVRFVAFLNAAGQALDAAARTFRGDRNVYRNYTDMASPYLKAATGSPLSVAERAALPNSLRIWIGLAMVGMISVIFSALYRDDEEFEEFNDYMRATHWFFKVGGVWWRVPKPFELAVVANAYEAAFDRLWRQDPRALTLFLESLRHTVSLPADVQGLAALGKLKEFPQAAWESITGTKDPYKKRGEDNPVPTHLRRLPPEMQFTAYTSELGRLIGKTLGWSPAKVDAFMTDTFATLGRDVMAASDQVLPAINRNIGGILPGVSRERADKSLEDHWIISRFTRREARAALSTQTFWQEMSRDGGRLVQAAEGYKEMLRSGKEHEARQFLNRLKPEEKAFALLRGHFEEKDADIHPLHRAQQVMSAMSGMRKDMLLERLYRQSTMPTKTHRARDPERIVLSPSKQKVVNEILEDLTVREARNALVVMRHPGWAQKKIMPTAGLIRELEVAAPAVADELGYRLTKGRNKVYPFGGVRKAWAIARDELLKEGADAELSDARAEAKWGGDSDSDGLGVLMVRRSQ